MYLVNSVAPSTDPALAAHIVGIAEGNPLHAKEPARLAAMDGAELRLSPVSQVASPNRGGPRTLGDPPRRI